MPDSAVPSSSDSELRAHVERVLNPHYEVEAEIGRGGMGIVYRAKDRRLKRTVAIKVLPPELAFRSEIKTRFLREAETAAQLSHPNIVPIYSVDEVEGLVYFVMAYIRGDNLAKQLHDRGVMPVDEVRRVVREVADALAYAHERGVIHRDIKPDNILLDADSARPLVTDFGIARAVSEGDSRLTATGIAIGTPTYMSPEQAAGEREIDGRSDLYSLGVLAYQMLTGEPPFVASSTPAMLVKHISERPTPIEQRRTDIPPDLARAVMALLEKEPADRFPTAGSVVAALDSGRVPTGVGGIRRESTEGSAIVPAPVPGSAAPDAYASATADDMRRWDAPEVQKFRRKVAPYLFVNGVVVLAAIFGGYDFLPITVLWSIYLAFKYAKLWADGYDWRDVFRQPRDRELIDVAEDLITHIRSIFDRKQRQRLREERRARRLSHGGSAGGARPSGARRDSAIEAAGQHADRIRRAQADRDEIRQLFDRMSSQDKSRITDVPRSADALADRVRALALSLADLERNMAPGAADGMEEEIARLERAANPLDSGSDERVRRLAYLKRQRRAYSDVTQRRDAILAKLETCGIALQSMKFDVLRLSAGAQTHQHVTSLAIEALSLAHSVDEALYVADEMRRLEGEGTGRNSRRSATHPG